MVKAFEAEAAMVPLLTPVVYEAEVVSVFLPSEPCLTFTVFVKSVCVPLVLCPVLKDDVKVYFVPSIIK